MKKCILCLIAITTFYLLTIYGCKKDVVNITQTNLTADTNGWVPSDRSEDGPTVLGVQHSIPYKVDIIKQAYNNLFEPNITTLSANHLYVRFLPQNTQDVKKLLESGIEFWDTPLDYDITSWGERYHDPSIADSALTYQYAVVEVGKQLPTVSYEILEQLALVPEDCAIAQEAFRLTGNIYDVPEQFDANPTIVDWKIDYRIEPDPDPYSGNGDNGGSGGDCGCPYPDNSRKPSGCVQVFDNMLSGWEGVINVEVHTG